MKHSKLATLFVLTVIFLSASSTVAQKMKAEDVIAKHLDSIGTSEARAEIKSQIAVGDAQIKFVTQKTTPVVGRIVIAAAGEKNFWGMHLNSTDYPSDKFSYDGNKAKVAFTRTGFRSILGNFVLSNNALIKDGLLGGTLSHSWSMLNTANHKAKISFDGTKKVAGKEAYVLGYLPKGGSDVDIKLYFDKETFRHVRTEYKRVSSAGIGLTPEASSRYSENRITLTEDFSDFKPEGKLTLPHSYRILYSATGTSRGSTEIEWTFNLTEFAFNQNLAANTFDIDDAN
jgi:hypothetical protein